MRDTRTNWISSSAFSTRERERMGRFENTLARLEPNTEARIRAHLIGLNELAGILTEYPSISAADQLGTSERSESSLIERIIGNRSGQDLFLRPTKALLGRAFLAVKTNLLAHIELAFQGTDDAAYWEPRLRDLITRLVHAIMAEEALGSIAADADIAPDYRKKAARELVRMWEHRLEEPVHDLLPPLLDAAWWSRRALHPVPGTMAGTAELFNISMAMDVSWHFFLQSIGDYQPALDALEEFLFDLTFEEIRTLRVHMKKRGLAVIDPQEAEKVLAVRKFYSEAGDREARTLHRFFNERRLNAEARLRIQAEGPRRTLEEYLLLYLLSGGKSCAAYLAGEAVAAPDAPDGDDHDKEQCI